MLSCKWIPSFMKKIAPLSSQGRKMEVTCFSEMLVTTCKATWHHNSGDHNEKNKWFLTSLICSAIHQYSVTSDIQLPYIN
jgi:hypothetical protein